jgi:serine/threonine-protein kinase
MLGGFGPKIGIRKGDVLAGKYRVDWVLGTGSTGVVLAAYHLKLHERVALKLLLPEALANPEAVGRFEREARAAVKIKSEHVVRIIDVGQLDEGAPFIVMEHLEGEDLAARLARTGPLPVEEAVDFMMQACEAIAEAHGLGIVHRDLKPANLFCVRVNDGPPTIKVLDFGISKVLDAGLHGVGEVTKTSVVVGSPFYMSPEQMQAPRTVDVHTDIWSIGVILHELLTGNVPFGGETLPQIAVHVAKSQPPSLRLSRTDVPPGLEAVILKCLEKSAKKRFKSVADLAAALGRYGPRKALSSVDRIRLTFKNASERPFSISVPPEGDLAQQAAAGTSPSWGAATTRTIDVRSRRNIAAIAGAGALLAAVAGVWWIKSTTRADVTAAVFASPSVHAAAESEPPPPSPPADDPTRAYPVTPGARVAAVPPPTGTGSPPAAPRVRATDPKHAKPAAPQANVEPEAENAPLTAPVPRGVQPKGEGTCLLNLVNLTSAPGTTIALDGNALGSGAKVATSVWAGTHSVVFRSPDGQTRKTTVTCAPGDKKNVDARSIGAQPADGARGAGPDPCPLCERP